MSRHVETCPKCGGPDYVPHDPTTCTPAAPSPSSTSEQWLVVEVQKIRKNVKDGIYGPVAGNVAETLLAALAEAKQQLVDMEKRTYQAELAKGIRGPHHIPEGQKGPVGYFFRSHEIIDSAHSTSHGWIVMAMASQAWWTDPNTAEDRVRVLEAKLAEALSPVSRGKES
jgi:hypothetical protein